MIIKMTKAEINKIDSRLVDINVSSAKLKIGGKEYRYQNIDHATFLFGFVESLSIIYQRKKTKIIKLPENRITIFDNDKNEVHTFPYTLGDDMGVEELAEWLKNKLGYDINKISYLIIRNG